MFDDFRYTHELRGQDTAVLFSRARVDGKAIEMAEHLRLRPDGRIEDFTVFFRPLPAAAAALRARGTGLGRRKSPARGRVMSAVTRPLAFITRVGDRMGVRLIHP
ncbi:MAG TPA: hypothetical protein VG253_18375 [Streptosporangiaceae bacterium]|nr:hypothetical protein [Streptosporangiaceae bacterium]